MYLFDHSEISSRLTCFNTKWRLLNNKLTGWQPPPLLPAGLSGQLFALVHSTLHSDSLLPLNHIDASTDLFYSAELNNIITETYKMFIVYLRLTHC